MTDETFSERHETDINCLKKEVSELKQYRSAHDAKINVYWHNQHEWDEDIEHRVGALERIYWKAMGGGALLLLVGNIAIQWFMKQ